MARRIIKIYLSNFTFEQVDKRKQEIRQAIAHNNNPNNKHKVKVPNPLNEVLTPLYIYSVECDFLGRLKHYYCCKNKNNAGKYYENACSNIINQLRQKRGIRKIETYIVE